MLFNSFDFFLFLAVVLPLYFVLPLVARQVLLVAASFFFYMYWNVKYSSIILFFIVLDYWAGRLIEEASTPSRRKLWLVCSLACNLGVLAIFKYYNFFMGSLRDAGVITSVPGLGLLLPLGISFHTFQTMSYTIDVYRGKIPAERSILRFAVFVSMFPQMVAGPIERARDLLPQVRVQHRFEWNNLVQGGTRILDGFIKKVVLADNLAEWVNTAYAAPGEYSGLSLLLATWMFAWQIYFDFSGYSDIAIGIARVMGFRFTENFDMPYISTSIQEFWRRWHMSLSSWLRDYLYIALGGNRKGETRTYANLAATMLLGGLWHGASWNFVIWGGLHGSWLAMERLWRGINKPAMPSWLYGWRIFRWIGKGLAGVLVFNGVCLTWVFFRAETLSKSTAIISRIVTWQPGADVTHGFAWAKLLMIIAAGSSYFLITRALAKSSVPVRWAASIAAVLMVVLFGAKSNEFIYFVF